MSTYFQSFINELVLQICTLNFNFPSNVDLYLLLFNQCRSLFLLKKHLRINEFSPLADARRGRSLIQANYAFIFIKLLHNIQIIPNWPQDKIKEVFRKGVEWKATVQNNNTPTQDDFEIQWWFSLKCYTPSLNIYFTSNVW